MGETILVVDYEESIRHMVVTVLESAGFQVFQADAPDDVRRIIRSRRIDLLVCNIVLPGMSGVQLALEVQETRPELRVLLTTGQLREVGQPPAVIQREEIEDQPFRPDILIAEVQRILRGT